MSEALQVIESQPPVAASLTPAQAKVDAIAALTLSAYQKASQLALTDEEIAALTADFPDEAFKPGAAGKEALIYIEHAFLRDRLNKVFKPGQWAIVPRSRWAEDFTTSKGNPASRVYVEAMLCIRGCFAAEAVGEMEYYPNNAGQNYGDAVEGAKTAALRRCCKELGIGLQAWKKDWCDGWWKRKHNAPEPPQTRQAAPVPSKPALPVQTPLKASGEATDAFKRVFLKRVQEQGWEIFAWHYAMDHGWILPNERLEDAPANKFPHELEDFEAIAADIKLRKSAIEAGGGVSQELQEAYDKAHLPPEEKPATDAAAFSPDESEPGGQIVSGIVVAVSKKDGKSTKGPWVRYGVKLGDEWYNTFDRKLGQLAEELKGQPATITYKRGERGNDLLSIEPKR